LDLIYFTLSSISGQSSPNREANSDAIDLQNGSRLRDPRRQSGCNFGGLRAKRKANIGEAEKFSDCDGMSAGLWYLRNRETLKRPVAN
jgi:hypothetical protein